MEIKAKEVEIKAAKTYASPANARKAILNYPNIANDPNLRFFINQGPDGRFFPVFIGQSAAEAGVHFAFNVIG